MELSEWWTSETLLSTHVDMSSSKSADWFVDSITDMSVSNEIDWTGGNITYVPLGGNLQTYIDAAAEGDTLFLGSGTTVITTSTLVNKSISIVGCGRAGFATVLVSPRTGTLISCATSSVTAFLISADNVRLSNLSIDMTGTASLAVNTTNNLQGLVFDSMDAVVSCPGVARGFSILGSTAIFRDLTFYVTSTDSYASGIWANNDASTTQNAIVDCYNVTGIALGAATYGASYVCYNDTNPTYTITLNLSSSICQALPGTPLDTAVSVSSSGGSNNAVVNAYFCTFDGADYDLYQTGTNALNVGGSVLANGPNSTFGTVTYRSALAAGYGAFSSGLIVDGPATISEWWTTETLLATHVDISTSVTADSFVSAEHATSASRALVMAAGSKNNSMSDPGADRLLMWDESADTPAWATAGTNLSWSGTTLNATGGGDSHWADMGSDIIQPATNTATVTFGDFASTVAASGEVQVTSLTVSNIRDGTSLHKSDAYLFIYADSPGANDVLFQIGRDSDPTEFTFRANGNAVFDGTLEIYELQASGGAYSSVFFPRTTSEDMLFRQRNNSYDFIFQTATADNITTLTTAGNISSAFAYGWTTDQVDNPTTGQWFLDTDASTNGSLYVYSNGAWRKAYDLP
jgi:hypothetical protein